MSLSRRALRRASARPVGPDPIAPSYVPAFVAAEQPERMPLHALPVLRRTAGRTSVLLRPVCGGPAPRDLVPAGDWRELPADRQCSACHELVAA